MIPFMLKKHVSTAHDSLKEAKSENYSHDFENEQCFHGESMPQSQIRRKQYPYSKQTYDR